jgi:hypothetical protein
MVSGQKYVESSSTTRHSEQRVVGRPGMLKTGLGKKNRVAISCQQINVSNTSQSDYIRASHIIYETRRTNSRGSLERKHQMSLKHSYGQHPSLEAGALEASEAYQSSLGG